MLNLVAIFENSIGRKHRWVLKNPDPTKTVEEIRQELEEMTKLNLFEKDGVVYFKKLVSAKFVETIERPLFDLREEAAVEDVATTLSETEVLDSESFPGEIVEDETLHSAETILAEETDMEDLNDEEVLTIIEAQLPKQTAFQNLQKEAPSLPIDGDTAGEKVVIEEKSDAASNPPKNKKRPRQRLLERMKKLIDPD